MGLLPPVKRKESLQPGVMNAWHHHREPAAGRGFLMIRISCLNDIRPLHTPNEVNHENAKQLSDNLAKHSEIIMLLQWNGLIKRI